MNQPMTPLSPEGRERADRILHMARAAAAKRRQRRRVAKRLSAIACMLIIAAGTFYLLARRELPPIANSVGTTLPAKIVTAMETPIVWIKTDPTLADALSIRETGAMCKRLNDDELLDAMEKSGRHVGLVYDGARASVVYLERK